MVLFRTFLQQGIVELVDLLFVLISDALFVEQLRGYFVFCQQLESHVWVVEAFAYFEFFLFFLFFLFVLIILFVLLFLVFFGWLCVFVREEKFVEEFEEFFEFGALFV